MRDAESGPVNGAKSFMMVAPLVLLDAVCAHGKYLYDIFFV